MKILYRSDDVSPAFFTEAFSYRITANFLLIWISTSAEVPDTGMSQRLNRVRFKISFLIQELTLNREHFRQRYWFTDSDQLAVYMYMYVYTVGGDNLFIANINIKHY